MEKQLKNGYKNTEVGVIPVDWEVKTYAEVFNFLSTASYSRAELNQNDAISYIHYGDIHTKWDFHLDINKYNLPSIKREQLKNYSLVKEGDIIMADASEDYSGIGKSVEIKNINSKAVISGLHTFLLRDKDNYFVNGFKGYIHCNLMVKSQFDRLATGLKVYGVSKANLKTVQIPLPPLKEQKAIANALSDADVYISSLEELIQKKQNIKQAAMQKLLKPKKDWEVRKLGEVLGKITTGKLDANAMKKNGQYRFYTCAKDYYFIDEYAFDTEALLVSGNGANVGYIHYYKGKFNAYQRTYILTDFSIDVFYIKLYLDSYLKDRITTEVSAGNTPYIKMDTITDMIIHYPNNKEEQTQIATILSDMDNELEILEEKLQKAEQLKQGMMQNLLTGKIRLL